MEDQTQSGQTQQETPKQQGRPNTEWTSTTREKGTRKKNTEWTSTTRDTKGLRKTKHRVDKYNKRQRDKEEKHRVDKYNKRHKRDKEDQTQSGQVQQETSKFASYLGAIYPVELEFKETTETINSAACLDIMLSFDTHGNWNTSLYDKRDDFNFNVTNFPFWVTTSCRHQHMAFSFLIFKIRYTRTSSMYSDFVLRARRLSVKLLSQIYICDRLTSSLRKLYSRHGEIVTHYDVPLSWVINDILRPFVP